MFLRARSAMTLALFSSAFWMAMPAAEVVFLLARSCVAWRSLLRAASRRISFWRAAMAARVGLRRISSSASLTSDSALSMAYWDSSSVARESASALTTCCWASARSASASLSLNSCSVVSNWTTTSPGATSSPGSRREVMAISAPAIMGAVSISELPPWSSPRAATVRVTRPCLTLVVGISRAAVAVVARMRRRAPQARPPTTARTVTTRKRRSFIVSLPSFRDRPR